MFYRKWDSKNYIRGPPNNAALVHNLNGTSIGSSVLAQLVVMPDRHTDHLCSLHFLHTMLAHTHARLTALCPGLLVGSSVAEWLACWTQAQKGPGSNRCRVTVLGKLFTPIVPLFTKQQNW